MKFELFNAETNKVWNKASGDVGLYRTDFELDVYKKLLSFFQVGDFYYIIFNISKLDFEFVSAPVKTLLGYEQNDFTLSFFMEIIHPDDRSWLLTFESAAAKFLNSLPVDKLMKYKVRYDYRVRTAEGNYLRILHQSVIVEHDEQGGIIRTLSVETDITHLKKDDKPVLSIIGLDDEPSYVDIDAKNTYFESNGLLSKREKQVLLLLLEGKLSREIAQMLNISKLTVDNHRKNMMRKNNVASTGELIAKAIKCGWI